jgi:hypothetical protein
MVAIVAALERAETEVTPNLVRMLAPAAMTPIVREAARAALDGIAQRDALATRRSVAEAAAIRAGLEQEIDRLRVAHERQKVNFVPKVPTAMFFRSGSAPSSSYQRS